MENNLNQQKINNLKIVDSSSNMNISSGKSNLKQENETSLKFKFLWQSNSNPYSSSQIPTWETYDEKNQQHLNQVYDLYCKDKKNFTFMLKAPSNLYSVNFKEMYQFYSLDKNRKRPIKVENLLNNTISDKNLNEDEIYFFWKSNEDPWDINQDSIWSPYDMEDELLLRIAYKEYLKDLSKKKCELKNPTDHYIDFSKMLQINKNNYKRQRPVRRDHPINLENIIRKNRFLVVQQAEKLNNQIKVNLINQDQLQNESNLASFINDKNNIKETKKIYFEIIQESDDDQSIKNFPYEIDIKEELFFFEDNNIKINYSLNEIKSIIIKEIHDFSIDFEKDQTFINSAKYYESKLKSTNTIKLFFEIIVKIYTYEGFLYRKMNEYLRIYNIEGIKKIKIYYFSLLASLKFFSEQIKLNNNDENMKVYRGSRYSDEEFKEYESKNFKGIIRIFYEFISTSKIPDLPKMFFNESTSDTPQFFWEIKIPKILLKYESSNFSDITKISYLPSENEILIRSGAIIEIEKIIPYYKPNEEVVYPNKYRLICSLKSFSLSSMLNVISLDASIEELNLSFNNLGDNIKSMILLREALAESKFIKNVFLNGNKFGENEKSMQLLNEIFELSKSIIELDLADNNFGKSEKNLFYLKEAISINKSFKKLDLKRNNIGIHENHIILFKEAMEVNKTLKRLDLRSNDIGENGKKVLKIIDRILI